ncbi:MAG: cobalt-precorrin-6A reductase [Kiloniellales bacterium]
MSEGTRPRRLLILGGTAEARALAEAAAADPRLTVISSLAGRTQAPAALAGVVRVGGFGGAAGLARYLAEAEIDLMIDATHPFAARISHNAAEACAAAGVPRLLLQRPAWSAQPGDGWTVVQNTTEAAHAVADLGRRVFLALGRQDLAPFAALTGHWFLLRLIEPPHEPLPLAAHTLVIARGPFAEADEIALLEQHRIEVLVSKNSGGSATSAKLSAARARGLPVVMIARPPMPPSEVAEDVESACTWLEWKLSMTSL